LAPGSCRARYTGHDDVHDQIGMTANQLRTERTDATQRRDAVSAGAIGAMLEELSTSFTLEPGDVLSTGSDAEVGGARKPPTYLRAGDVVRVEIVGIGHIENRVVPEP
jgi:2-keto-4-pentenoate hydratase/2-oxohepta-3-ene-1,7-dioic acid hydratase in catechol pathway